MPTADQYDAQYENDTLYAKGVPVLSDEQIDRIYQSAGIDVATGLPVKRGIATGRVVAGSEIVFGASDFEVRRAARACGCPSCAGALQNIKDAVEWYAKSPAEFLTSRRWARSNRRYFIQQLREIVFSQTVKHNQK